MNTVEIKLVINGKEAIATLQLTDENVQKMDDHLNQLGQRGANSVDMIRQRYSTLVALMESQPLGSKEFEELSVMTAQARKELDAAEAMMQKSTGTTGNARMAVTSFSQTLSDSTQFQNGFRYGMMAVSNNLEQMFSALGRVKEESAATGQSMSKTLVGALSGPGGVMIALSGVMVLLQVLPGLLEENDQKMEEFSISTIGNANAQNKNAEAIENVMNELKEMGSGEIIDSIINIENQIRLSSERTVQYVESWIGELKAFLNTRYGFNLDVTGGEGENAVLLEKSKKAAEEELANRSRVKILEDDINALKEAQNKKGVDLRVNLAQIEAKERERNELLKSSTQRMEEQAAIAIRMQRVQVDAMEEGYLQQRAAADLAFNEAKANLDQEFAEKKITQFQYTELLKYEEQKRSIEYRKIDAEKNKAAVDARAAALKRMAEMDSSEASSRIALDERIALSKTLTEEERLRVAKEFAIKRVEAEALAQQAILEIERQAIQAKMQSAPTGSKERESLVLDLDANDDALQKVLQELQAKKTEIIIGFKVDSESLDGLDTIAGIERKIAEEQSALSKATTDQQREAIQQRIDDHKSALLAMSYREKDFARDVYAGLKDLYGQVSQLISQSIQQDAEEKILMIESSYRVRDERLNSEREAALNTLQIQRDQDLSYARSVSEKEAVNKKYNLQKQAIEKQFADAAKRSEQEKESEIRKIKIDAFNAQKAFSYATALINIAEGITRILATVPPPFNVPLIAMTAATGAVQLAAISASKPPGLKDGGVFKDDGIVRGPGGPRDDKVNAHLSNGEFVVRASVTERYLDFLNALNAGMVHPKLADGGVYTDLEQAERISMIPFNRTKKVSGIPDQKTFDTSRLEKKLDEIVPAIEKITFMVNVDGEPLTAKVEQQQAFNRSKVF